MKRKILLSVVLFAVLSVLSTVGYGDEDVYYARCNLKVLKDNSITWINWQAAPSFIPVGTKLRVTRAGNRASVVNPATNAAYTLDIGADGDAFLDKFVTKRRVDITSFPSDVQANIRNAVAKVGMTKEQVYIAMGPPTNLGKSRTNNMTYENIMGGDLWVYARRRFGKAIGVAFDPGSGRVNRTEGIWGK
ncbi:MAG: outer membrane protein assembly factor BamE [Deltaproteobacteria bacterium]|nr:outer membrane protein assembly factor BamE [Deltaproteobacteria bacterium]